MDEMKWDKDKHDKRAPRPMERARLRCTCGGMTFVQLNIIDVIVGDGEVRLDTIPTAPLCVKCNTVINPQELLKKVMDEGIRPDSGVSQEGPKNSKDMVVQDPRPN